VNLQRTAQPKPSRFDREVSKFKRQQAKAKAKRQEARRDRVEWALVCLAISKRDASRCRVCGRTVKALSADPKVRAEVHHIVYRSAGGSDDESNLLLTCGECHFLEHQHRLDISGHGDGLVTIVTRDEAGKTIREWASPCPAVMP
jgi:5-methylcytosine-specific restriction endonuclease McrA